MKHLKTIFACLLISTLSIGQVWGDTYEKVALADITSTDVVLIVGTNSNGSYAMSNDKGTSSAPAATSVTIKSDEITTTSTTILWNVSGDATSGYTFYPNGSTDTWLYCTNTNNGVRVGTNASKTFKIDATSGYLKHDGTSRYVGIYNNADWRCYTSTEGNIANQTFTFYKKKAAVAPAFTISAVSNDESKGTVSLSGSVITGSPKTGYRYANPAYSVSPANSATVAQDGNAFTVTPSANTTITINFEAIPTHNVIFNSGEVKEIANVSVAEGTTYSLSEKTIESSLIENCTYKKFEGWTTASSITDAAVKPTILTSVTMGTLDVDLYPVYSVTSGNGGTTEKTATVTVSEYASLASWGSSSSANQKTIIFTNSDITATANSGTNSGKYYSDGWRIYQTETGKVTISTTSGTLKSVKFAFTVSNTGTLNYNSSVLTSGTAVEVSGTSAEFTVGNSGSATNGQVRITAIEVVYTTSSAGSTSYSLDPDCAAEGQCVSPAFTPAAGTYNEAQSVELSTSTEDADIYYTLDGTTIPSATAGTKYTEAISVTQNITIKAIAIADGMTDSEVATATYTLQVATPEISGATSFLTSSEVTITAVEGATIYYTDDNSEPTTESTLYSAPFTVDATKTIKAIAIKANWNNSEVAEQAFTKVTPLSVTDAIVAIDNSPLSTTGIQNQYVKGIISKIDGYNGTYHSITYWISNDGTTTNQLEVYSGLAGVVKTQFEAKTDLKEGEEVIVKGTLKKYGSTYEFDKNNEIVAYRPFSPIAWSKDNCTAELVGSNNVFPTLNNAAGLTITYASSDATKASFADASVYDITLNAATGETPITITATSAANEQYVATSVSYSLTITEEEITYYSLTYEKNGGTSDAANSDAETNLPATLPTITKAGYNFGGWYTDSEFETPAEAGAALTENTTLYAQWLDPYTVAEALTMINALADNGTTEAVYVAGVVTDGNVNIASKTATYYIKDAGASNSLKVYNGKGLNNSDVAAGDIIEDDAVVLYGQLQKYVKNSTTTPEVTSSYIYKQTRPTFDVESVSLPSTANTRVGKTITLTATITPANATNKNVTWRTSNDAVATVDGGVVTGVAEGTAVITVTTEDGGFTANCTVTVAGALPTFSEADHEWIKITNASKLVAGRYYVIAQSVKGTTATNEISGGALGYVATAFSADKSIIAAGALGTKTAIFELGGSADAWTLFELTDSENTGYLSGASTSSLAWSNAAATNAISFNEDGNAVIGSADGYRILYNNSSPRFKPYSGAQTSMSVPQLYMWAELSHSVTFDANGGVAESVPGVERTDEGKIIIPATEPTHADASKVFAGWYINEAGTGTKYEAGDEFATSADVTLYAKWSTVPTYTVTYIPGGSGTIPAVTSYPAGKSVTIATVADLSNPGYLFTGWIVKDADLVELDVDEDNKFTMPAKNVTITAQWSRMSSDKWILAENVASLEDGAQYIIVGSKADHSKYYAMGAQAANNRQALEVVKDGRIIRGSDVMAVFTLNKVGDNYTFNDGTGYLYAAGTKSSGNNYLRTETDLDADNWGKWTISDTEDGISIVSVGNTYVPYMQFNPQGMFSCYSSASQQPVALYKKAPKAEVNNTQEVDASTISAGTDVTIHGGGKLVVDEDKLVADLNIENGGKIELEASTTLTISGTFTITATMAGGASGQITGTANANIVVDPNADVYFDIKLARNGDPNQWHAFTVPFPVDAINGVFDLDNNKLTNEVNYAIMSYHGDLRANGQYGWKKYRGILQPGTFYLITVDGLRTDYRFKKVAGEPLVAENTMSYTAYTGSSSDPDKDYGWNGLGNPTLAYGKVGFPVQILDPDAYEFVTRIANSTNFVVGTPFFYKAGTTGSMVMATPDADNTFAPARTAANEVAEIEVSFGNTDYKDNLYISASEDALNSYEYDKDLVKMSMNNTPRVAQIYGKAYGNKLSMVHAPLNNSQASYDLTLYAPAAGQYTIAAPNEQDADVYLTLNGAILWNIALSPYTLDLTKGNTEGYGLLLQANAPYVATGVDNTENSTNVQKVIINEHVYILRDGQCFDVTGKAVK